MKSLFLILTFTTFCSSLISCRTTALLTATFEGDTPGAQPNTNLPGGPEGDRIVYVPELAPQLIVNAGTSTTPGKALHFMPIRIPELTSTRNSWVSFRAKSTNLVNTLYFFYSAKRIMLSQPISIDLSDGNTHLFARMRIQIDGEIGLARNLLDNYTDIIGNVGTDLHTIVFTINVANLTYNVSVFGAQGGQPVTVSNKPMITRNALEFANPAQPTLSFSYLDTRGSSTSQKYVIEEVHITRRMPDRMR